MRGKLSHGSVTGWSPSWYAGYPIYTFYFVLPDLITALGSFLAPYDIVFKLVNVAVPLRVSEEVELEGLDVPEFGMLAYPED